MSKRNFLGKTHQHRKGIIQTSQMFVLHCVNIFDSEKTSNITNICVEFFTKHHRHLMFDVMFKIFPLNITNVCDL